jgi:hypothetical protein
MTDRLIVRRETHELKILTRPRVKEKRFCDRCSAEVRWLVPEEAMLLAKTSLREIFRLVEAGDYHFAESREGFLLLCAQSLAERFER